ncbi:MAG: hypothetical protein AAFO07_04670 [Bacteroidota bacterium]
MKALKITLFVLSLLGVGFISGFYTHRVVVRNQIKNVAKMRFAQGFQQHLYRVIEADSAQIKELAPEVDQYAQQIAELGQTHRLERQAVMDSMMNTIKPKLSNEQVQKLDRFSRRFRSRDPRRMKKREKNSRSWEK